MRLSSKNGIEPYKLDRAKTGVELGVT